MRFRTKEKRVKKALGFEELFDSFLAEFNLKKSLTFESIVQDWPEFVGPLLQAHCEPVRLEQNTLYVLSDHSVFSNDLIMLKGDLIKKISEKYDTVLGDIRITTKTRKKKYW